MYCPNCGNQTSTDQKFCRACGLGLEKIAQSLGEQLPARMDQSLLARKERLEKFGVGALSVFGVGILSYLLYPLGQKLLEQGSLLTKLALVGFVIMLGCGLLSVILFARAKELGEQASKRQPNEIASGGSTKELPEARFEPVSTVTDRTTELLFAEKRDTKKSNNGSGDFA
ncbi:MAG TPA: zinc ribbon domain-containing protein [Pyrinomonadaceae bacterium]|nr:zinc ribbon domain-containing protein [Pyrinomonadaceae bacterium]